MPRYRDQLDPDDFDTEEEFEAAKARLPARPKTVCLQCGYSITWATQRQQFGRLMRKGFSVEDARKLLPRCQVCLTATLRGKPQIGS